MQGTILRGIGGFYYAMDDDGTIHTLRAQGKIRRERLKPKVGDRVELTPGEGEEHGWIHQILPRRNDLTLADRMLINARRAGIEAMLVVNKSDLNPETAADIVNQYRGADVSPMAISASTGEGLDALRQALRGKIHALSGQSGAGKSTLVNALYGLSAETGDLSRKIERGKNTTRHCELIPVPDGGMVLDTPGFSLLETDVFDPVELKESYPEFAEYEGQCFFQPCYHATEPRCAVTEGKIDAQRHERYAALLNEMKQRWRERYD